MDIENNLQESLDKQGTMSYNADEDVSHSEHSDNEAAATDQVADNNNIDMDSQPPLDPEEATAKANGWKPEGRLTAREFNLQGEWIGKTIKLRTQVQELEKTNKAILDEQLAMKAMLFDQNKSLLQQRSKHYENTANETDDADTVRQALQLKEAADRELSDLESKYKPKPVNIQPDIPEEYKEFIDNHRTVFFGNTPRHKALQVFAQDETTQIENDNPHMSPGEVVEVLKQRIADTFSIRLEGTRAKQTTKMLAPTPDKPTKGIKSSMGASVADLNDVGMNYYKTLVGKGKTFSEKEFLELARDNPDVYLKAR